MLKRVFNVMTYYLMAHKLYRFKIPILPKIIFKLMRFFFSCSIPYTADIHKTVTFPHNGLGVVIGHDTKIGAHTKILQNVTIGGRSGLRANPIIGKNVLIGAGACIIGKVVIGDDVKIGANAVVIHDVPSGSTAVGIPAKILNYDNCSDIVSRKGDKE